MPKVTNGGFPVSTIGIYIATRGGNRDGRKKRSWCFNLGLGNCHCRSGCIGRRVCNVFEAIRFGAENEIRQQSFRYAPVRR